MSGRDPAADQLMNYKNNQRNAPTATTSWGVPLANKDATLTVPHLYDGAPKHTGSSGYALLQDVHFLDEMAHFDRERIPERVVHAKGAGAFGYFEVTHDITKYSSAKVFSEIGKRTPISVRFSTVGGESGSADTVRDPRGFAVKFYTEDGIWDLVGNNTPIFFIRDPILFPSFIHTQKRNPQTHLKDADMFWDFISLRAESTHQVCILFSDRGIPDGYRHMNGYGSHTFKLVTSNPSSGSADFVWCKFHYKTNQGIQNLPVDKAGELSGSDPDYGIKDLYNAIAAGNFPSWTFYVQIMTDEQARNSTFNPFDVTKVWPHSLYPLIPVGRLVLDQNPVNYFHDVEQAAYSPAHLVPGIEASPDRMLQGRLFSYDDTHRHRLGPNYTQIPVNCPYRNLSLNNPVHNYQRDGPNTVQYKNQIGAPNYHPNSFTGPEVDQRATKLQPPVKICPQAGGVQAYRYDSGDEDNYSQATVFYQKTLDAAARERLASNIAGHLSGAAEFIRERAVRNFTHVSPELGKRITELMPPVSSGVKANL